MNASPGYSLITTLGEGLDFAIDLLPEHCETLVNEDTKRPSWYEDVDTLNVFDGELVTGQNEKGAMYKYDEDAKSWTKVSPQEFNDNCGDNHSTFAPYLMIGKQWEGMHTIQRIEAWKEFFKGKYDEMVTEWETKDRKLLNKGVLVSVLLSRDYM
jgi:hypothetical protein